MNPPALVIELDDDAILESEVRILTYLSPEGERLTRYRMTPDIDYTFVYGCVSRIAHDMLHDIEGAPLGEDEEG